MASPTTEERVSRLEGGQEHLATKADVERIRADMERFRADVARWVLQLGIAMVGVVGVGVAIIKLT